MAQDTDLMATAGEGLKGFFDMQGDAMREMLGANGFDSLLGAGMKVHRQRHRAHRHMGSPTDKHARKKDV